MGQRLVNCEEVIEDMKYADIDMLLVELSQAWNALADITAAIEHQHGFHNARMAHSDDPHILLLSDHTALDLMHSELSEATEGLRRGNPESEKIPGFTSVEEELADAVIRIASFAATRGHAVGTAIMAKVRYNHGRPFMHGGKKT